MKKFCYLILLTLLASMFSCNLNSRFTSPSDYIKYAGQVNGGSSGGSNSSKLVYHTLTINVLGSGSVSVNDKNYTEALKFLKNTKISIEAVEATGSAEKFQGWSGSIVSTKEYIEDIIMDRAITLTASFVIPTVYEKLILNIRKGGGVEIDGVMHRNNAETNISVIEEYEEGTKVTLKAIPNDPNIAFGGWSGSVDSTNPTIEVTLADTVTLGVSFSTDKHITINNTAYSYIEISVDNSDFIESGAKSIEVEVEVGDNVVIKAKAKNERTHEFVKWTGSISSTSPDISTTIGGDLTLNLEFRQIMKTLTIIQLQGQAVYRVNGIRYTEPKKFPIDTDVNVELVEKYYPFISWSGDANGSSKTVNLKLDVDRTLNATLKTGVFDTYDNPDLNGYSASQFNTWVLFSTKFDASEIPYYILDTYKPWSGPNNITNNSVNIPEYSYRSKNSSATSGGMDVTIKLMDVYQYRGANYYYAKDFPKDTKYHQGLHLNRLQRFYFHRFIGEAHAKWIGKVATLDNALCAIDTYTKLVYGYAVPDDFSIVGAPGAWYSVELKDTDKDLKFYEYDPIGFVKSDGTLVLFDSFRKVQTYGATTKPKSGINYLPTVTYDAPSALDDFKTLSEDSIVRSPYLE